MRFASIDIGTVTCRLLVADVDETGLHELDRGYRITNLGEDVDATGSLKPEAMQRVADAVGEFMERIRALEPADGSGVKLTAMATSASRDASNAADFQAKLAELGVELSVIPGEREAALSFMGASCGYEGERVLVVDTGGGSTEVVAGIAGQEPDRAFSFNIGCRRVTERFLRSDPPAADEVANARAWMREEMRDYFAGLRQDGLLPARVICVAGTATSVVSVHEKMAEYDASVVQGYYVSADVLDEVYELLAGQPLESRAATVGLDPGRAPVIAGGLMVLQTVLELAEQPGYTASESDILQGIILTAARG